MPFDLSLFMKHPLWQFLKQPRVSMPTEPDAIGTAVGLKPAKSFREVGIGKEIAEAGMKLFPIAEKSDTVVLPSTDRFGIPIRKREITPFEQNLVGGLARLPFNVIAWKADLVTNPAKALYDLGVLLKEGLVTDKEIWDAVKGDEQAKTNLKKSFETMPVETTVEALFPIAALFGLRRGGKTLSRELTGEAGLRRKVAEKEKSYDSQAQEGILHSEPQGEEPGRPVQVERTGKETAETGRILQAPEEITGPERVAVIADEMVQNLKIEPYAESGVGAAKQAMIAHHAKIREPELFTRVFTDEFQRVVPDPSRQSLVMHALQQKRNPKFWDQLTEKEKGVVEWVEKEADRIDTFVRENKVLSDEVLEQPTSTSTRYLFQWWRDPKTGDPYQSKYGKFSKTLPQAKQRKFKTYEEGIAAGLEPVTFNVGRIIGETWQSVIRAHQSRQMHDAVSQIEVLNPGLQVKRSSMGLPKQARMIEKWKHLEEAGIIDDYVMSTDHFWNKALTYIPGTEKYPTMMLRQPIGIHKELYPFWKAYHDSPTYGNFAKFVFTTKSMKLLSLFHGVQLGVNQAATGHIPFVGIPRALKRWKEADPTVRLLHKHGLDMPGRYEDINYLDLYKFKNRSVLGKIGNVALKPVEWNAKLLFQHMQPGMKMQFAYTKFHKLLPEYEQKGLSRETCARDVVKAADQFFSGEDYKRAMLETNKYMARFYFGATARKAWQMAMISPTWQRENIILVKNVLKSMIPESLVEKAGLQQLGPSKSIYRKYALGAFVGMYGAANLYNYMMTKEMDGEAKFMWENPHPFGVRAPWNTPEYTIKRSDGTERRVPGGRPVYIRPFKTIVEVPEFFFGHRDPKESTISNMGTSMIKKAGYKVAPWLSMTAKMFYGYQYNQPSLKTRIIDWMKGVFAPITYEQVEDWIEGKKTPQDVLGSFFGMPTGTISLNEFKEIFYERWARASIARDSSETALIRSQWDELGLGGWSSQKAEGIKDSLLLEEKIYLDLQGD